MIDPIVEQYQRHGWTLRRILLTKPEYGAKAGELRSRYADASIIKAEIDALWFSRPNRNAETWELRRLSGTPFALLEVFDTNLGEAEREEKLHKIETRMAETLTKSSREIPLEK